MATETSAKVENVTYDRVRITLERHGRVAKIEVNGIEVKYVTKLLVNLDGDDRMSRVTIELAPEVVEIDGEVSLLELTKRQRILIPREASGGD